MNKLYQHITHPFKLSFAWIYQGLKLLRQRPLAILLVSGSCVGLFLIGFFAATFLRTSFALVIVASLGLSVVFPLTLTCLAIVVNSEFKSQEHKFKFVLRQIWESNSVRLIIIYLLLVALLSLGSSYLTLMLPAFENSIGLTMEVALLVLQLVSLLAIPCNIATHGTIKPFKLLALGLRALLVNFIPCFLFLLIMLLAMFVAIVVAKLAAEIIGVWALIIYVIELWLFVTWFGLSAAFMARKIMGGTHPSV